MLLIRSSVRLTHGFLFLLELDLAVEDDVWSLEMFVVRLVNVPISLPYFSVVCFVGMW